MRRIPPALQAHLQQSVTTTACLLLFALENGTQFGATTHDRDIYYQGIKYSATRGFNSSIIATDSGLSVDNGEATGLLSATMEGITLDMIRRGYMDNATWEMRLVNWADLSMGHVILDAGDVGEITTQNGVAYISELLSYAMRLKQNIGTSWSRTCRSYFGTDANSQTGCGVDADAYWIDAVVTGVDVDDPFRLFSATALTEYPHHVFPGRVNWTGGENTGPRLWQVEAGSKNSGTIGLFEAMPFPIEVGDQFRFRADCNKTPDHCKYFGNFLNYKGEPYIPVADGLESQTPGASVFGGISGTEIID